MVETTGASSDETMGAGAGAEFWLLLLLLLLFLFELSWAEPTLA